MRTTMINRRNFLKAAGAAGVGAGWAALANFLLTNWDGSGECRVRLSQQELA